MLRIRPKQSLNLPVRRIVFLIAVLLSPWLKAQILDDSTKLVYGPSTTKFITEEALLNNHGGYQLIDTSIYLFERQSFMDASARKYQNLGSFGTALFPVFYTPQSIIGRTSGYNAYRPYAIDPSEVNYYDTKSPYLNLFVYLGGGNRNIVDVGFSRNVNSHWNVGFDYRKITTDKQLARNGAGDRQVVGSSFVGYTHYKNLKVPYQVMANFSVMNHNAFELGGVRYLDTDSLTTDLFQYDNALLRLQNAKTNVKERQYHLYQDFQLVEQFQLYHKLDYRIEENNYTDYNDNVVSNGYNTYVDFYPNFLISPDTTLEQSTFSSFENEAGIKGDLASVFYRAYLRLRSVDYQYNTLDPDVDAVEKYIGGYARFQWRDKFTVEGNGEFLVGGEYSLGGSLSSELINVSYQTTKYNVPFIYRRYTGNHHDWANDFEPIFTNTLKGNIAIKFKNIELIPSANFTTYQNYTYFDANRQAAQTSGTSLIGTIGGNLNFRFFNAKGEGWHIENEVLATEVTGGDADVFRIPQLFYNARIFWRGDWFGDQVPIEVGVDAHARSGYFANNYAPELQQYYLQDEFEVTGYYKADLFVNMRLDKFSLALKWTHFNQPVDGGYFSSPYYPGQPRVVDLIVRWMFFD